MHFIAITLYFHYKTLSEVHKISDMIIIYVRVIDVRPLNFVSHHFFH